MKLIFFLLVLLKNGGHPSVGLQVLYSQEEIILKYFFQPCYNSYVKACCKFYQSECFFLVNNRGLVAPLYLGRIVITNYYGEFEVKITNRNVLDAGGYRCGVIGFPATSEDVEITVSGVHPTKGLHVLYSSEGFILKYLFQPYYNNNLKACCKVYQSECFFLVNNRGQVAPLYEGRIFITNYYGEFEVKIMNLKVMDAGRYRCGVIGFPATSEDVEVTVSDFVTTAPLLPKSSIKPAVWPSSSPSTLILSENDAETLSDSWKTSYTLVAVSCLVVFAFISVTLLVYHLKTRVKKSKDTYGTYTSLDTIMEVTYILQSNPADGQMVECLMTRNSEITEVQYVRSQDGVQQLIPQQLMMKSQGNHIQINGQTAHHDYENDDSEETAG